MELTVHIGSFKLETAGCLWRQIGPWTFYYHWERPQPNSWKRLDAWRSQDDARYVGWTVVFLNRQVMITRQKSLTPEQEAAARAAHEAYLQELDAERERREESRTTGGEAARPF